MATDMRNLARQSPDGADVDHKGIRSSRPYRVRRIELREIDGQTAKASLTEARNQLLVALANNRYVQHQLYLTSVGMTRKAADSGRSVASYSVAG